MVMANAGSKDDFQIQLHSYGLIPRKGQGFVRTIIHTCKFKNKLAW